MVQPLGLSAVGTQNTCDGVCATLIMMVLPLFGAAPVSDPGVSRKARSFIPQSTEDIKRCMALHRPARLPVSGLHACHSLPCCFTIPPLLFIPSTASASRETDTSMAITLKTPEEIVKMRVAGRLAAEVLEMIGPYVKPASARANWTASATIILSMFSRPSLPRSITTVFPNPSVPP